MINSTRRLLDYWIPPEGAGRPISAVATTFTFDTDFFEQECLGRFLGIDTARGEGDDLAFLINQEERLAEASVSVLVDRSSSSESRSLRWDLIPVGIRGGLLHAKVAVLAWERLVRFVVSSANLTETSYRTNVEVAVAVDAADGAGVPQPLCEGLLAAVEEIARLAPGQRGGGPRARCLTALGNAGTQVSGFGLPSRSRGSLLTAVAATGAARRPVLSQLDDVWRGGPPREAVVLSPFFDGGEGESRAVGELVDRLAKRGPARATFVVATDASANRTIAEIPRLIHDTLPARIEREMRPFLQPDEGETRRLHAKSIVFESSYWTAAIVGSSNFTSRGLGAGGNGHLEVNLALGAPARSKEARLLRELIPMGDPLDLHEISWEPAANDDEAAGPPLPWGFEECLVDPGPPLALRIRLRADELPLTWRLINPRVGRVILTSRQWVRDGRQSETTIGLDSDDAMPYVLEAEWRVDGQLRKTGWAVNVTEPGRLPPPSELRELPVSALLQALASSRPIHEALAAAVRRGREANVGSAVELDPLKRYSQTGQLLQRARQVSAALEGLRQRLERPAHSLDALEWRLNGPIGPRAVAEGLLEQLDESTALRGESAFLLAELALTLTRVSWSRAIEALPKRRARAAIRGAIAHLNELRMSFTESGDAALADYVQAAFDRAKS